MVHYSCTIATLNWKLYAVFYEQRCLWPLQCMINFAVFCIESLQFYYKHIIRSEKNKPSPCATDGYLTLIIINEHETRAHYYGVFTAYSFLLIYFLVYRRRLGNDVMRDAALPWFRRNYTITFPRVYVSPCHLAALHHPHMFPDKNTVHHLTQSETKIMRSAE